MGVSADRLSGGFFLLFGLAMYFLVNPTYIETVEGGNLSPNALPNVVSLVIAFCGGLLLIKPTPEQLRDPRQMAITGLYVAVLVVGIWAMSLWGFEYVAPALALVIMGLIGERRPLWLGLGVVGMPALIWFLVTQVLGRALP